MHTLTHTQPPPPERDNPKHTTVNRYYRPELDALRFLAFMIVFIVHRMDFIPLDPAKHYWVYNLCLLGDFGVPVFFLLSAFLITELLLRESDQLGTVNPAAFYARRILRIWPLYFAVFFGLVLFGHYVRGAGPRDPKSWLAFTFFAGNWYICRFGWIPSYPVNPLWSISVEEQFYIAIPLIARFGGRIGLKIISLSLIVLSYICVIAYARHGFHGFSSQWTNSFVEFQFFSAGALLSIFLRGRVPNWPFTLRILGVIGAAAIWLVASIGFGVQADTPQSTIVQAPIGWALVMLGTTLLFLSLLGTPARFLPPSIVYLGRISYGLYVFHELVYYLVFRLGKVWLARLCEMLHLTDWRSGVGTIVSFVITIVVAHLSYQFYERPFLRLKRRFTIVPSRD
jgi:peptidoglycan/LPS O-acetylase OafA/YrhL